MAGPASSATRYAVLAAAVAVLLCASAYGALTASREGLVDDGSLTGGVVRGCAELLASEPGLRPVLDEAMANERRRHVLGDLDWASKTVTGIGGPTQVAGNVCVLPSARLARYGMDSSCRAGDVQLQHTANGGYEGVSPAGCVYKPHDAAALGQALDKTFEQNKVNKLLLKEKSRPGPPQPPCPPEKACPPQRACPPLKADIAPGMRERGIRSKQRNNFCLDVANWSRDDMAPMVMWDCHGGANQQWTMHGNGTLQSKHSGKCLDIAYWGQDNGTAVIQYGCHGGANQRWFQDERGRLRSMLNDRKCLDVAGGSGQNGSRLVIWDCHDGPNQKWVLG